LATLEVQALHQGSQSAAELIQFNIFKSYDIQSPSNNIDDTAGKSADIERFYNAPLNSERIDIAEFSKIKKYQPEEEASPGFLSN
jgi:hypothetical protein